jgi:hypothetical protein
VKNKFQFQPKKDEGFKELMESCLKWLEGLPVCKERDTLKTLMQIVLAREDPRREKTIKKTVEMERLLKKLRILENRARAWSDGHLTIFRFTTNWKILFATPEMPSRIDQGSGEWRGEVQDLPGFPSLEEAVEWAATGEKAERVPK